MNRRNFIQKAALTGTGMSLLGKVVISGNDFTAFTGKRIGIIGLDTSHSEVFTKMINTKSSEMSGYRVVAAYPHGSPDIPSALKMKPGIIRAVRDMGVGIVESIEALLDEVDVVLLESNDGRPHLEQALPVFRAGKRIFIDKPVAANLEGAYAVYEAAKEFNVPVFSSSALRFDVNVQKVAGGVIGKVHGADVYTPAEIEKNHSDLAWYAIHGIEMLFTVMGPGCKTVTRTHKEGTDLVVGVWNDDRIGTVRCIREGASGIAGTAFGDKGIAPLGPFSTYEPLVRQIIGFFETGRPPVQPEETLEIFSFIHTADESKRRGGRTMTLLK